MNKTIIININSIVFHIEEDAYETLRSYMIEIKKHFSQSADSGEILLDIENRVAEMFTERIQHGKKEVISSQDVEEVIGQMGRVSDFEEMDETIEENHSTSSDHKEDHSSRMAYEKKLMRNADDKVIGGVCSGLGYYFGLQTKWVRVLFVLFVIFGGSGVLLYAVLWIVMPVATSRADRMAMRGEEPNLQNFKKEFENYQDEFDKAQGHIEKGAKAIGSGVSSFFSFIAKSFVFLLLIICGMTIFGMLFTLVGFGSAIFGLQNDMVFPGLDVLSQSQAVIALIAGVMAITIPFLALFNILVRILFKTNPMNNYFSLSLWAGWIISVILVVFFSFMGAREFREESTIKIDRPLARQDVYYFSEKDIRLIEGGISDEKNKIMRIEVEGEELSTYLRRDINIRFEYLPEGEDPYIQYNYFARGNSYKAATKRASEIEYQGAVDKGNIVFDSHFSIGKNNDYRDQEVSVIVYLPIGSKVVLNQSISNKLWGVHYHECLNDYDEDNVKNTEWVMKKAGLSCAPNFVSTKNENGSEEGVGASTEKQVEEPKNEISTETNVEKSNTDATTSKEEASTM